MSPLTVITLSFALFLLAATPGPGVFATISRSIASGFYASLPVIAGIVTGDIIFLLLAITGMSIIAEIMGQFFLAVKLIGGGYLIYLGIRLWMVRPSKAPQGKDGRNKMAENYAAGLSITLSNPKVILFYCGFLPGFIDLSALTRFDIAFVCVLVTIILAGVLTFYALLAGQTRRLFEKPGYSQTLNRTAGSIMIGTGTAVLLK